MLFLCDLRYYSATECVLIRKICVLWKLFTACYSILPPSQQNLVRCCKVSYILSFYYFSSFSNMQYVFNKIMCTDKCMQNSFGSIYSHIQSNHAVHVSQRLQVISVVYEILSLFSNVKACFKSSVNA